MRNLCFSGVSKPYACSHNFISSRRSLRKEVRKKRKTKITVLLDAAQSAAAAGDMHKLYKEVRKLSPKNPKERIQIRGPDNQILSQASEHAEIVKLFSGVFTRHACTCRCHVLASTSPADFC